MNRFPRVSRVRRILAACRGVLSAGTGWAKAEAFERSRAACVLAALLVAGQAMATDRYVATNGVAPNDGSTWSLAYRLKILGTNRTTTVINAAGATQQVMVVTNCVGRVTGGGFKFESAG